MKTQSMDTSPEVEKLHFDIMRRAGDGARAEAMRSLTSTIVRNSRSALVRQHPEWSKAEIRLRWTALWYGEDVAVRIKESVDLEEFTFADHDDPFLALKLIIEAFEQLGVPYYVGGAFAASIYGEPRSTIELDITASLEEEQVPSFVESLHGQYYVDGEEIETAISYRNCWDRSGFSLIHYATFLRVNISILKSRPYEMTAMMSYQERKVEKGENVPVVALAAPEDVILTELELYFDDGKNDQRWRDVMGILKMQRDALDFEYLNQWAGKLNVDMLLQRAFEDAGIEYDGVE